MKKEIISKSIPEKQIQSAILDWLRWNKILCWRNNAGKIFFKQNGKARMYQGGLAGQGDIFFVLRGGKFGSIEVKRQGNKPTSLQQKWIAQVNKLGGIAFIAHSIEEVEKELKSLC